MWGKRRGREASPSLLAPNKNGIDAAKIFPFALYQPSEVVRRNAILKRNGELLLPLCTVEGLRPRG